MKRSLAIVWIMFAAGCAITDIQAPITPEASPESTQSELTQETTLPVSPSTETPETSSEPATGFYALVANSLEGQPVELSSFMGKVTLIVNVASECGYTPQYRGLQKLHEELKDRGFSVLAFPSNEFGGQEPGSPEEIKEFCTSKYGVTFPMFSKVHTKRGIDQSPIYQALNAATDKLPNWNFCKYLVGRDGKIIGFFPSKTAPEDSELRIAIDEALKM